jgi:hypothetical protein
MLAVDLKTFDGQIPPQKQHLWGLSYKLGASQSLAEKVMKRTMRQGMALVKSVISARRDIEWTKRELEQARQQLKRTRRQLQQTKQRLQVSRRYLKQAAMQYEKVRTQNERLGPELKDMARAYLLCLMPKGSVCAEIGVHVGEFSKRIFDTVEPERLHLIDPWRQGEGLFGKQAAREQATMDERHARVRALFAEEVAAGRVRIHRNLSDEIVDDFKDSYFGWIYIDGNHLYEYVKRDLELYYPKVKEGGYLAGDDYGVRGYWDNGVRKAVDEFVSERPGLSLEVKASQFIIQKGSADRPVKCDR